MQMEQHQPAGTIEKALKKINKRRETTIMAARRFLCARHFVCKLFQWPGLQSIFKSKILTRVNDESNGLF